MPYTWPDELDDARRLLGVAGSFWAETYAGSDLVESLAHAKARQQAKAHADLLDLAACLSRLKTPVLHREEWTPLVLRESDLNAPNLPKFDGTHTFLDGLTFGQPVESALFAWPLPPGLATAAVVANQITDGTVTYVRGVDFTAADGAVRFRTNPFADPAVRVTDVFSGGTIVDREARLWAYAADADRRTVHLQYGYAIGLQTPSTARGRDAVNAAYDGLVLGTTARAVEEFVSALCDLPIAVADETVLYVAEDNLRKWVVTAGNAYGVPRAANLTAAAGDVLRAGQSVCDALTFHDLNRGEVPAGLTALSLGRGLLAAGFFRELVFHDADAELLVEEDVDGYTKVAFSLGGWPVDVAKFWADVHAAGVAAGDTLAMRLDLRANKTGQPTSANLPATVNPLRFLVENVFRGNAFVVTVRPAAFGRDAVGLSAAWFLRKLVPPQTACILVVRLDAGGDVVTMDGPGSDTKPGYEEEVLSFFGNTVNEPINPTDYMVEGVRLYQIGGHCQ